MDGGPGRFTSLELCAGAGGLSLGLEQAGFDPVLLIDEDPTTATTLFANRPPWPTETCDLLHFVAAEHPETLDVDLLAAGLPRLKANATSSRLDDDDERRLIQATAFLAAEVQPAAVLIENMPGLVDKAGFEPVRRELHDELEHLGFKLFWQVLNAQDFGVPQKRLHGFMVALKPERIGGFAWPTPTTGPARTVGETLLSSMQSRGWPGAVEWAERAGEPAPTIVGGSKKRGGADLGPRGSKEKWARLGVNGGTVADHVPDADFQGDLVSLTVRQVALLQGFPPDWVIPGAKTAAYRQVSQVVPPPLAAAVGAAIARALRHG
jgi:DNA (cytosine-5)-methyltransferase 1